MAALSASSTVDKWDLLPKAVVEEFKIEVLTDDQYVTLAKAINRPKFMLKLLYNMLKRGNVMGNDKKECANYLVQYLNTQSDGDNESKLKVDPVTFFMNVFGGMNAFPWEFIASMTDIYNSDKTAMWCLKSIVMKNDMKLNTLALKRPRRGSGERARKIIFDREFEKFIEETDPYDKWKDYFNMTYESDGTGLLKQKVSGRVTERDLAFQSISDWGIHEWQLAKEPFIMLTPELEKEMQVAMKSAGLKEDAYVDYKKEALSIDAMDMDVAGIDDKMKAIEALQRHEWLVQIETFSKKMEKHFDFQAQYIYCDQNSDGEGWAKVDFEDLSIHLAVIMQKLTSKGRFSQAIYPLENQTVDSQTEIETGAKNANLCDMNWTKSRAKQQEAKLTNATSAIGEAMYNGMSPSSIIEPSSPACVLIHKLFLELREEVLGEQHVSYMKDVAAISYSSGTQAFIKAQAMEWLLVDLLSKVIIKAGENGQEEKLYKFKEMIVDNGIGYEKLVFHSPLCLWRRQYIKSSLSKRE